jgi:two-component system, chemotaxis family, chemotaxis protein CheY
LPNILIVDDSAMIRDMLKYALLDGGYTKVTEAFDGLDGLEKAKNSNFDLIITDIRMPKMNGLDLVKNLREMYDYSKVPIFVLSTESSDDMKTRGKENGATGWITKPFLPNQILKVVAISLKIKEKSAPISQNQF